MAKAKAKAKPKAKAPAPKATRRAASKPTAVFTRPLPPPLPSGPVLRTIRSVIYQVTDLARAKEFYATLLGRTPYFDQSFYVGFDVEGQELGLNPDVSRIPPGPGGAIAYWRVDDLYSSWEFSLGNGAEPVEPPHNVGVGTDVAIVADPFGNYLGLIQLTV